MKLKFIIFIILIFIISKTQAYAMENSSKSSAFFAQEKEATDDSRVKTVRSYLSQYNSPLASSARIFVEEADKYGIDWRFVAAISGVESTFGQAIPANSYNAWGWGVYGNHVTYFTSWDDGIKTISKGLKENYINRIGSDNIYQIGSMYAASPTWAQRVAFNMEQIGNFSSLNPTDGLSISL